MALADDKVATATVYHAGNAMLCNRVKTSGFTNVLAATVYNIAGTKYERLHFFGATAPSTNYDAVAEEGDRYTLVSAADDGCNEYVYKNNAWVGMLVQ